MSISTQLAYHQNRVLYLEIPMQFSVNQAKRSDVTKEGTPFTYTPVKFARRKQAGIEAVKKQVYEADWTVDPSDRYKIFLVFWFPTELTADLDNPLKPTLDVLKRQKKKNPKAPSQPKKSKRARSRDVIERIVSALEMSKPESNKKKEPVEYEPGGALFDDNRTVEIHLYHTYGGQEQPARITIEKLPQPKAVKRKGKKVS